MPDPVLEQSRLRQRIQKKMRWARRLFLIPTALILVPLVRLIELLGLAGKLFKAFTAKIKHESKINDSFVGYEAREGDVFVAVYVKSGTNWMMQMTHQIANLGRAEFSHIHDVVPWPDGMETAAINVEYDHVRAGSPTGLRIIKTHLPLHLMPYSDKARYICVVRDPKDVYVSMYHFFKDVIFGPLMPSTASFLDVFLSDSFLFGSWAVQADSFWRVRDAENVLFLTFAEMKRDRLAVMRQVADFMGVALDEATETAVFEKTSFEYMRTIDHKFYPGLVTPWSNPQGRMMRAGRIGGASEMLTPGQMDRIDAYCMAELAQLNSDFPYEQLYLKRRHRQPALGALSKPN